MVQLFGRTWSKEELCRYAGNLAQIGGVTLGELADGNARGVRTATFETGTGFRFTVLIDRGMDIGPANYRGAAVSWQGNPGPVHPAYHDREGLGFLRTFHGGLLAGCGMTYMGAPCVDEGEALGLHGRLGHISATNIWADGGWRGDEYEMWVLGRMRETVVFGENITNTRRVWARLGESRVSIRDVVVNEGFAPVPHQMLYHCNFGFPMLAEGADLIAPSQGRVRPRDDEAAKGMDSYATYEAPINGYTEQVFYHDMQADDEGYVTVVLANRAFADGRGLGAYVKYRKNELPRFTQWKEVCAGTYVTGLEPCNAGVEGRAKDRSDGTLPFLQPGERREYMLEIGVLDGNKAIDKVVAQMPT